MKVGVESEQHNMMFFCFHKMFLSLTLNSTPIDVAKRTLDLFFIGKLVRGKIVNKGLMYKNLDL